MKAYFKVTFGFCAMICILAWLNWRLCVCFLIGIAIHELSHLIVLRICRIRVSHVRLSLRGAVIETGKMGFREEVLCAAAGPVGSLLFGFCVKNAVAEVAVVSIMLGLINCLPLYPLDGGRMLRGGLYLWFRPELAEKVLYAVGFVVAGVLMVLACWGTIYLQTGIWPMFAVLVLLCRTGEKEK